MPRAVRNLTESAGGSGPGVALTVMQRVMQTVKRVWAWLKLHCGTKIKHNCMSPLTGIGVYWAIVTTLAQIALFTIQVAVATAKKRIQLLSDRIAERPHLDNKLSKTSR